MDLSRWAKLWLQIILLILREAKTLATFWKLWTANWCKVISNSQCKPFVPLTIKVWRKRSNYWTLTMLKTTNKTLHCCQINFKMCRNSLNTQLRRTLKTTPCCTKSSRCPICWTRQELEKVKPSTTLKTSKASFSRLMVDTKNQVSPQVSMEMSHLHWTIIGKPSSKLWPLMLRFQRVEILSMTIFIFIGLNNIDQWVSSKYEPESQRWSPKAISKQLHSRMSKSILICKLMAIIVCKIKKFLNLKTLILILGVSKHRAPLPSRDLTRLWDQKTVLRGRSTLTILVTKH